MRFGIRSVHQLEKNIILYLKDNLAATIAFAFFLVAGIAAGVTTVKLLYPEQAPAFVALAPAAISGTVLVKGILIAVLLQGVAISTAALCAVWTPWLLLWPVALLLRGFLLGAGLYACVLALPGWAAVALFILLQVNAAISLPCLLLLYGESGQVFFNKFAAFANGAKTPPPQSALNLKKTWKPIAGLLFCGLLEGVGIPCVLGMLGG